MLQDVSLCCVGGEAAVGVFTVWRPPCWASGTRCEEGSASLRGFSHLPNPGLRLCLFRWVVGGQRWGLSTGGNPWPAVAITMSMTQHAPFPFLKVTLRSTPPSLSSLSRVKT
jgi:hypothetical protein